MTWVSLYTLWLNQQKHSLTYFFIYLLVTVLVETMSIHMLIQCSSTSRNMHALSIYFSFLPKLVEKSSIWDKGNMLLKEVCNLLKVWHDICYINWKVYEIGLDSGALGDLDFKGLQSLKIDTNMLSDGLLLFDWAIIKKVQGRALCWWSRNDCRF